MNVGILLEISEDGQVISEGKVIIEDGVSTVSFDGKKYNFQYDLEGYE